MNTLPLMIDLSDKKAVIVGGGNVAVKRVRKLYDTGAFITVISPQITPELENMVSNQRIRWKKEPFQREDLKDAYIVVIATNDKSMNEEVLLSASHVPLVNEASDSSKGNFIFPAHVQRGKLSISITTHGASPMLSAQIKKDLEKQYDQDYEAYVDFLYECRQLIKKAAFSKHRKQEWLATAMADKYRNPKEQLRFLRSVEKAIKGDEVKCMD